MALKSRMKEYRARLGLTQQDLADMVGVRRETIVCLEQGRYNPSLRLAWSIAKALGATVDEMFWFTDDE